MKSFKHFLVEDDERVPFPLSKFNEDNGGFQKLARIVKQRQSKGEKPVDTVEIRSLKASQDWINRDSGGKQPFKFDDKPIVFYKDGINTILDGHHRLSSMKEDGKVDAKVYYYEEEELVETTIKLGQKAGPTDGVNKFIEDFNSTFTPNPIAHNSYMAFGDQVVKVEIYPSPHTNNAVHIQDIASSDRMKGNASKVLKILCKMADKHDIKLELDSVAYDWHSAKTLSPTDLTKWYERHGFEYDEAEGFLLRYPKL